MTNLYIWRGKDDFPYSVGFYDSITGASIPMARFKTWDEANDYIKAKRDKEIEAIKNE